MEVQPGILEQVLHKIIFVMQENIYFINLQTKGAKPLITFKAYLQFYTFIALTMAYLHRKQWSLHFKTTHGSIKMWSFTMFTACGRKIKGCK